MLLIQPASEGLVVEGVTETENFDMVIGLLDDLAEMTGPLKSDVFIAYPESSLDDE